MKIAVVIAVFVGAAAADSKAPGRKLVSAGCNNCCFQNDCSLAFSQTSPGICCGAHRARGQVGCCPMGASCVACANIWKCTRSTYITSSARCRICSDDMPPECLYRRYHTYHHGGSMLPGLLLLLGLCGIAACMFYGNRQQEVVMVQQPVYGQQVIGPNGQPMIVQGGGYYDGGANVAGAAATGFVGGMLVGEMMDHGDHGYGYGGGYGGEYGGGYGGDMGGGDAGFGADQ